MIYLDAYVPLAGQNEIDLWPPDQKKRYDDDIASGVKFRSPIPSSILGITDPNIFTIITVKYQYQRLFRL